MVPWPSQRIVVVKLAFITNYEKTIYFHRIARKLEQAGHDVSWIAPSHHWAEWLASEGTARDAILDLSVYGREWREGRASEADRERLAALESASGVRFNDVALMDRILRVRSTEALAAYFAVTTRELDRFIAAQGIDVVFAEQTFGVELMTGMVCRAQGRTLLVPHVVRIPSGRMGFFRGHLQAELAGFRDVTPAHRAEATAFLETFRRDRPRPEYFLRNDRVPVPRAEWPAKLLKHARLQLRDPYDETHFSPAWLVKKRVGEVVNALSHRLDNPFWVPPQPPPRPFVLFPLHRQPESSIDVLGSRLSNQVDLVRALTRTLPATHDLYVKEHPNGLGDRSPRTLRELRAIPGVRLVDPKVSTFALSEAADLVITVSGTAAYEAALLRRPAAAIADMFFGPILTTARFNPYEDSVADLLAHRDVVPDSALVDFLANVIAQSYPGFIDNPTFSPRILDEDNISSVARGFLDLLASGRACS